MKMINFLPLFTIFTLFISTFSKMKSNLKKELSARDLNINSTEVTQWDDADGQKGTIFYLDRHHAKCQSGAISYFQLERQGGLGTKVRYLLSCLKSDAIAEKVETLHTNYTATGGDRSVNFLDRHNVACPNGSVLSDFSLERNPNDVSQIRYKYQCKEARTLCCTTHKSSSEDMGDRSIYFLDRQKVGENQSRTHALQQFKLFSTYNPDKMYYEYTLCKLMDMDADDKVIQQQNVLRESLSAAQKASQELAANRARDQQVQSQLKDIQSKSLQSSQLLKASQEKSQATIAKVEEEKKNLQNAEAHPGLKC
jgi:hypothetical protein